MQTPLAELERELSTALADLSSGQTQATPAHRPGKWCIQQVAEHLLKTYQATIPVLQTRLEKRSPTRAQPSLAQRLGQFGLITLGRFPSGHLAPAAVSPSAVASVQSGDELLARLHTELTHLDQLLNACTHLFGSRRRAASHMILGPLSMHQWGRFHLIHGRHHIRQIQAIRSEGGF